MTRWRNPVPAARVGLGIDAHASPTRADRERDRAEFLAEIHGLAPAGQLRHTVGVLCQTLALQTALGSTATRAEEAAMTRTTTRFSWRCTVLRRHRWVGRSTEDGGRYQTCARCGRDRYEYPSGGITPSSAAGDGIPLGF